MELFVAILAACCALGKLDNILVWYHLYPKQIRIWVHYGYGNMITGETVMYH